MSTIIGLNELKEFITDFKFTCDYTEKAKLRDCPLVLDGCDLMSYLYLCGQETAAGVGKKSGRPGKKGLPNPHWFGGDWETYSLKVRTFFQQLKQCGITPIVVMDGVCSKEKVLLHWVQDLHREIKENVKPDGFPGNKYEPMFLKTVFLEVLAEQNILRFQTLVRAEHTIAFVARLLGDCCILSSKNDYVLYINNKALQLQSVKFTKELASVTGPIQQETSGVDAKVGGSPKHALTLQANYISIQRICDEEFKLTDRRLFTFEYICRQALVNLRALSCKVQNYTPSDRIAKLMVWLGRKESLEEGIEAIMRLFPKDEENLIKESSNLSINEIVSMYEGKRGECGVWLAIKQKLDVGKWMNEEGLALEALSCKTLEILAPSSRELIVREASVELLNLLSVDIEAHPRVSSKEFQQVCRAMGQINRKERQLDWKNQMRDYFTQHITLLESKVSRSSLPKWYFDAHTSCELQSYLMNMYENFSVMFRPQVECFNTKSCHQISSSILKVIAGILISNTTRMLRVVTRTKGNAAVVHVNPILSLECIGGEFPMLMKELVLNHNFWGDINKKIVINDVDKEYFNAPKAKKLLVFEQVLLGNNIAMRNYVQRWPETYRIWIASLLHYFVKQFETEVAWRDAIPIFCAIFFCIFKNLLVNPSELKTKQGSSTADACNLNYSNYSQAVKNSPEKLKYIRAFYQKYEDYSKVTSEKFKGSYNIKICHALSEYQCVLFQAEMLNCLLNKPFKSPNIRCTLNNFLMYQLAAEFINCFVPSETTLGKFTDNLIALCGVKELSPIIMEFLFLDLNEIVDK